MSHFALGFMDPKIFFYCFFFFFSFLILLCLLSFNFSGLNQGFSCNLLGFYGVVPSGLFMFHGHYYML